MGQVVTVRGRIDSNSTTGTATEVTFGDDVEGPVTQLNVAAGTVVVLGQTVRVAGSTVFDNNLSRASIEGLSFAGLVVEVSGLLHSAGVIVASRIERKPAGGTLELVGTLTNLNETTRTFNISSQVIDYSQAGSIANGPLANNRLVEVRGTTVAANGNFIAMRVEVLNVIQGGANDFGEIEGIVTRFASNADFDVAGRRVSTDGSTRLITNGLTLALNVKVEVEGTFNASGVLVARKVELKPD